MSWQKKTDLRIHTSGNEIFCQAIFYLVNNKINKK